MSRLSNMSLRRNPSSLTLKLCGNLLYRGASQNETPSFDNPFGILSRAEIRTRHDVWTHAVEAMGISTTVKPRVARRFAKSKPDGAVHFIAADLIPAKDKSFVQDKMPIPHLYMHAWEKEWVVHGSIPVEAYLGWHKVVRVPACPPVITGHMKWYPGIAFLQGEFVFNPDFKDPAVINSSASLREKYLNNIDGPFRWDIGPAIRQGLFSESDKEKYQKDRQAFSLEYLARRRSVEGIGWSESTSPKFRAN